MRIIADLHIHSKYSRATSKQMDVANLDIWAKKKGIDLMATGDFTHPKYLAELRKELTEWHSGIFVKKENSHGTKFILSTEISCIYKDKEKTRRLHLLILAPNFASVEKLNETLTAMGCNLKSDGRPIIGLSAKRLAQICFDIDENFLIIPAHAWTPWFALFGSKSGYDSLTDCFEELSDKIFAIETGLSSDPKMNWRWSHLDKFAFISNSDAHSPLNIGREANIFDLQNFDYEEVYQIIKNNDRQKFLCTIEFFPEEGKYHFDGHADCLFSCSPDDAQKKYANHCPKCGKELILGVDHRIFDLADRAVDFVDEKRVPFRNSVPLLEIIAEAQNKKKTAKSVMNEYEKMLENFSEFNILLDLPITEVKRIGGSRVAEGISRVRSGQIFVKPGYDGIYGEVKIFTKSEQTKFSEKQSQMF